METSWQKMTLPERKAYIREAPRRLDLIYKAISPEDLDEAEQFYSLGRSVWDVHAIQSDYHTRYLEAEIFLLEQSIRKLDWVRYQYQNAMGKPYLSYADTIRFAVLAQTYELSGEPEQSIEDFAESFRFSAIDILKAGQNALNQLSVNNVTLWQTAYLMTMAEYEIANETNPKALYCLGQEEDEPNEKINAMDRDELKDFLDHHHIILPDEFWNSWDDPENDFPESPQKES